MLIVPNNLYISTKMICKWGLLLDLDVQSIEFMCGGGGGCSVFDKEYQLTWKYNHPTKLRCKLSCYAGVLEVDYLALEYEYALYYVLYWSK